MFVKICGLTRAEDVVAAVRCGASAIGFVFWPKSPRFVDPYRARQMARILPPFVTPVGVFVNQPASYVNDVASLVGLGAVQLHGDEDPDYAQSIARPVVKAIATITDRTATDWPAQVLLLVDAHDPVKRGGTGVVADWTRASALARERPILLAGGLRPERIAAAIGAVAPFGIDVSSGVEDTPGIKNHERMTALFEALP
ncbi:MAG: phosphoribosylanthranilate isomerase [Acidobacteriaceae bacterium]|jgi:phosphoribosylanthranilate isomerase|nr:phosphoribosylanthranilate isomerase [Acidobacteriaceae bacterium]